MLPHCRRGLLPPFLAFPHVCSLLSALLPTARCFCGGVCCVVSLWEKSVHVKDSICLVIVEREYRTHVWE